MAGTVMPNACFIQVKETADVMLMVARTNDTLVIIAGINNILCKDFSLIYMERKTWKENYYK